MQNYLNNIKGLENTLNFDNHQLITFIHDQDVGLSGFIAIHRGELHQPAFGATRICRYSSPIEALEDVLGLSKTMSYKSALAGLKYGGAKAVIIENNIKPEKRIATLLSYAQKINFLDGHFITGADVGISDSEVKLMKKKCPHLVGVKVDPVKYTITGIVKALSVCLEETFGTLDFHERTIAIQGLGKIGSGLLKNLYSKAKKIYVADINEKRVETIIKKYPRVKVVGSQEIFSLKVDIFSPCALSGCININNINDLKCKIIAGGANSQLENSQIGELLHKLGILYAPDYIINAGGLISVVDEYEYHNHNQQRIMKRLEHIPKMLKQIIHQSKIQNAPTNIIADRKAQKISDMRK